MKKYFEEDIPNSFWKFYDDYRRKVITIHEFSKKSALSIAEIRIFLLKIKNDII